MKLISPSDSEIDSLISEATNSMTRFYTEFAPEPPKELNFQKDAYFSTNYINYNLEQNVAVHPPKLHKANADKVNMLDSEVVKSFMKKHFDMNLDFAWCEYGWRDHVLWHVDYAPDHQNEYTDPLILPLSSDWTFAIKSKNGSTHKLKATKYKPFIFDASLLHSVEKDHQHPAKFLSLRFFSNFKDIAEHIASNI